ncbi:MAG: hypothetical protein QGI24_05210 [Kiritimatiellia bacterium]|jgi:hypothetical protein|nr:hypothetical protein [Kiritimatiellia bacterium]MDP6848167.1 hypothetical protein [Kiritimatiellia bacterium]
MNKKSQGLILSAVLALLLVAVAAKAGGYKINPNPPTDGLVGSNYTPAYAVNQVQLWHDFRADVIEKELAAAKKYFGVSTLRVYLHNINFDEDRKNFMSNIEKFLVICEKHGIRPGFVFFDGCHRHEGIFLDKPTEPVYGYHNSRWAQCPQERDIDQENLEKFKPYVQEIIKPYRADKRVLFWEIHNEPPKGNEYRDKLKRAGYKWAKELEPIQPVLNCEHNGGWGDCEVTDIVDSHVYNNAWGFWDGFSKQNPEKGCVFTEAGARWKATRRIHGGPTDVISWLEKRRASGQSTPGVYLCWELMVGNSNCRWHWVDNGHKNGNPDPEPEIPWCGLMWPDATPVSLAEAEAVKRYVTGKSEALLLEYFESGSKGWKPYGTKHMGSNHGLYVGHGQKAVAGNPKWKDYIVEGKALLKIHWLKGKQPDYADEKGDPTAGLLVRVNEPGDAFEEVRCYTVSHTGPKLMLGKFYNKEWKELAAYDLTRLKTKSRLNEWNGIRVEAIGPRIRVWFNRTHGDPEKGLRIDYTDKEDPILSGAIGVASWKTTALFDDIVVLPVGKE